jgi:ATP-dependent RNA helicase SUPV3L1/SUV3
MGIDLEKRIRNVTAVLGPTNTGKTHLAIERMCGHETGMIGLPLRLLAREVYDRVVAKVGADKVALITGEEKIKPERTRYWVCTVEAMPQDVEVSFLAIDEIQLAADPERGHVFTDRLLNARGRGETLMLGAGTMRDAIADLVPGANFISRPRLSKLTYAGEKKITRLPKRTAIVAFSASEVYSIAELIRRQRGGAAVVLGALSPRTRNAQVALYQSGDVDFLVATDAIGMGLNLDVDHVAFAATRKFDGEQYRELTPAELAQIGGRAGRHMNDGTFGITGNVTELPADVIERLETHTFDPVKQLQWRNGELDFTSLDRLRDSLREPPREARLTRARMADDVMALETVSHDRDVTSLATTRAALTTLWDACQIPDYRKISSGNHAELVATVYKYLMGPSGRIPEDWLAQQVGLADRTDGDIDTLSNRLAHIRTWTFVSNHADWLARPEHWQERTRAIEDALSDALHERLTQRFVDRRTSALMKGMRDKDALATEIAEDGSIKVEEHYVGRLRGFRFEPDPQAHVDDVHGKATRSAAAQVLARELEMRVRRVVAAKNEAFKLSRRGRILWRDEEVARLEAGEAHLKPQVVLLADEHLGAPEREKVQARLETWIKDIIAERLKPLVEMGNAEDITGLGRGIAFRMGENFGALKRETVADDIKTLEQPQRAQLRKYGVRFGAFNIFLPPLLKPAAADLTVVLWALKNAQAYGLTLDTLPEPARGGLTSVPVVEGIPEPYYRAGGFHVCGPRAVRLDILERLADLIRPLLAWRPTEANPVPPKGSTGDGAFLLIPEMMSILGCSGSEVGEVLKALGFRNERRKVRPLVIPKGKTGKVRPSPETDDGALTAGDEAEAGLQGAAAETGEPGAGEPEMADKADTLPEAVMVPESSDAEGAGTEPVGAKAARGGTVAGDGAVSAEAVAPLPASEAVATQAVDGPLAEAAGSALEAAEPVVVAAMASAPAPAEAGVEQPNVLISDESVVEAATTAQTPETPEASEAVASTTDAAATDVSTPTISESEEKFEEVWRPRRTRPQQRPHRGRPGERDARRPSSPAKVGGEPAQSGSAEAGRADGGEGGQSSDRRDFHRREGEPGRDRGHPRDGKDRGGARHSQHGKGRDEKGRDDRNRDDRGRPGGKDRGRDQRGGDFRRDRDRDERRPKVATSAPPRRGGVDPDSPFAALGALKQQLEQRSKDRSTS